MLPKNTISNSISGDIDLQISHRDEFGELFNRLGFEGHGAEIGVLVGDYSEILRASWKKGTLHLIDIWKHNPDYIDIVNFSDDLNTENYIYTVHRFKNDYNVKIYRMSSKEASVLFPNNFFDWIYIDADHSYDGCMQDLISWYPKLKIGGILAGHDYTDGIGLGGVFGVKTAVDEFVSIINTKLFLTEENVQSWYFQKKSNFTSEILYQEYKRKYNDNLTLLKSDRLTQKLLYVDHLIKNNQFDIARQILLEHLNLDQNNIDVLNVLTVLEFKSGNFEEVSKIILKVLEIDPKNEVALGNLEYLKSVYKSK